MLESLLSSRVRSKLIAAFMLATSEEYNAWQLAAALEENYSAIWKELLHLEKLRILSGKYLGRSKIYRVNLRCSILPELKSIVLKTEGVVKVLHDRLVEMKSVRLAFIYGPYVLDASDIQTSIDLVVIGDMDLHRFSSLVARLEEDLSRPINYVNYSPAEWKRKLLHNDIFLANLVRSPKVMLIGNEDDLA